MSEHEIDAVLLACGGNSRTAIRALLVGQLWLQQRLSWFESRVSAGYCRQTGPNHAHLRDMADEQNLSRIIPSVQADPG